jgi:chorismate mutase
MFKKIVFGFFFLSAAATTALAQIGLSSQANMNMFIQAAERCSNLDCVRQNIDVIDSQLVLLLGQRLAYVKRAGELKGPQRPVHDQARESVILNKVIQEADFIGYPSYFVRAVFITILAQSNIFEQRFNR